MLPITKIQTKDKYLTYKIGDYQARDVELPKPEDGDILAIHDTGAYTMSMYCRSANILLYSFKRHKWELWKMKVFKIDVKKEEIY